MILKAVLFDVDGVLLDSFEANLKFFQDLMTKSGHRPPTREDLLPIFHLHLLDAIRALTQSASEAEVQKIYEMGRTREVTYDFTLLAMPGGVDKVIEELSKHYALGIVTSRVKQGVHEVPQLAKFSKYFKVAVTYEDTKEHKPNPAPLLFGAQRLGVKPEECVYVGDAQSDVLAARAANMRVIIYSKYPIKEADANTNDFATLPELIRGL